MSSSDTHNTRSSDRVQVLDVGGLSDDPPPALIAALDSACRDSGFFQVVNHGVDTAIIAAAASQARLFFAQPAADKQRVVRSADNMWGWYDRELTKNALDLKEIFDVGPADGSHEPQWPTNQPSLRPAIEAWMRACEQLSRRLLGALAAALGTPARNLLSAFEPAHTSFARLNHYPPPHTHPRPAGLRDAGLGISRHTDAGALTVLWQDQQPGLQVWHAGEWVTVPPHADALVINIGDVVQVWSNDRYRAPLHRVLATSTGTPRLSMPYFFNPAYQANYAPLPHLCDGAAAHYRAINWGEFRRLRAAGDYADQGAEVQIDHYRR